MPGSHRRHGQDKTRQSCLVRVGGVNWIGDKSRLSETENFVTGRVLQFYPVSKCGVNWVLSCLDPVSNLQMGLDKTVRYQIYWGLLKTVLTCRQFSSHHRHIQDKFCLVLSVSAMWTRYYSTVDSRWTCGTTYAISRCGIGQKRQCRTQKWRSLKIRVCM